MKTKLKGLVWLGVRTKKFEKLCDFYENKLRLPIIHDEPGFKVFDLPNGDRIEVFAENYKGKEHFTTGPVVGFAVDNVETARKELEKEGIKFIGPIQGNKTRWSHFYGPDGNIYEITNRARKP